MLSGQSFDLADPAVRADPYPYYRRLQESEPVARTPTGAWLLTRYQEVHDVLRDSRFAVNPAKLNRRARRGRRPDRGSLVRTDETSTILLFQDPPDHTRLRSLVNLAFTQRRVEALAPRIEWIVNDLLDKAEAQGGPFDLLDAFGFPLPVRVICEMLGVPFEDQDQMREWSPLIMRMLDGNLSRYDLADGMAAVAHVVQYFNAQFEDRRGCPKDDLLTGLVEAEEAGDRLAPAELRLITTFLFVAGFETTANLIGNGTLALFRHPDQLELLRSDPALLKNAVEELLRYDSPIHATMRIPTEQVEIAGTVIPPGEQVICALGAANRDPEVFPDPDRLDITRPNAKNHIAFSQGIHYCLGAALSRLEASIAFGELVRRFPTLTLVEEPEFRETQAVRGLRSLLVTP